MIVLEFDGTRGIHVLCGVTAHDSPGGPCSLNSWKLPLADKFH